MEFAGLREVGDGFGETFSAGVEMVVKVHLLLAQLLFEQRVKHHRRSAGIFKSADSIHVAG